MGGILPPLHHLPPSHPHLTLTIFLSPHISSTAHPISLLTWPQTLSPSHEDNESAHALTIWWKIIFGDRKEMHFFFGTVCSCLPFCTHTTHTHTDKNCCTRAGRPSLPFHREQKTRQTDCMVDKTGHYANALSVMKTMANPISQIKNHLFLPLPLFPILSISLGVRCVVFQRIPGGTKEKAYT